MKVQELRDKITEAGGTLQVGDIQLTYSTEDVDVLLLNGEMLAWIPVYVEGEKLVTERMSLSDKTGLKNIHLLAQLAQFVGVEVKGVEPITKTEVVTQHDEQDIRNRGMVEAYEKILIGRELTVGK